MTQAAPTEDTAEYVAYRLSTAGRAGPPAFEPSALLALHEATGGALRAIDSLASLAMQQAARDARDTVNAATMQAAIAQDTRQG